MLLLACLHSAPAKGVMTPKVAGAETEAYRPYAVKREEVSLNGNDPLGHSNDGKPSVDQSKLMTSQSVA